MDLARKRQHRMLIKLLEPRTGGPKQKPTTMRNGKVMDEGQMNPAPLRTAFLPHSTQTGTVSKSQEEREGRVFTALAERLPTHAHRVDDRVHSAVGVISTSAEDLLPESDREQVATRNTA